MGGKSEVINYKNMEVLYSNGSNYVSIIRTAAKNVEEKIAILRTDNLAGEKGLAYRQTLNALSSAIKELSRSTEKAAIFTDTKLNTARNVDLNVQVTDAAKNKVDYLRLKK